MTYRIDSIRDLPPELLKRNPQLLDIESPKPNKYHANKTTVDGITFDSAKEANRYQELLMLERAGQIKDLKRQVKYELQEGFIGISGKWVRPIVYVADSDYWEQGRHVVEDTKSVATKKIKSYVLKKKMFQKRYPEIEFRES